MIGFFDRRTGENGDDWLVNVGARHSFAVPLLLTV